MTVLGLTAMLGTACTSTTSGAPAPANSAGSAPSSGADQLPHHGAPAVTTPLQTTAIETDPCSAITNDQISQVNGKVKSNAVEQDPAGGKRCAWTFENWELGKISAGVDTIDKDGLSHLYALKAQGSGVTTFEPQSPILDYPAVVFANGGEDPSRCQLAVGLSNKTMYFVFATLRQESAYYNAPCDLTKKVAEFAIKHLKGA
ncbi:DUF3558 domain-containing protein [Amycolatopsis jejuensis]|uniref:DUF3558 domain-containing protein n=1 Tax=Amycolatopsis jejuensis TaxID=330084 RepID=UPI000A470448|nr:DUF3558 domain-containing protein [Amycolatopsis jejuensis]